MNENLQTRTFCSFTSLPKQSAVNTLSFASDLAPVHSSSLSYSSEIVCPMEKISLDGLPTKVKDAEHNFTSLPSELKEKLTVKNGINGIRLGITDVELHSVPKSKISHNEPKRNNSIAVTSEQVSQSNQKSDLPSTSVLKKSLRIGIDKPVPDQSNSSQEQTISESSDTVCNGHSSGVSETVSVSSISASDFSSTSSDKLSESLSSSDLKTRTRNQITEQKGERSINTKNELPEISVNSLSPSDELGVKYINYENEKQMTAIMSLIQKDLSEPYSIYTYRYFIHNWPKLCFLAVCSDEIIGAIVCKLDFHKKVTVRGYIAMLAVDEHYRKRRIGTHLVQHAIRAMAADDADEIVLETEITNKPALKLYENLGFVRDKRLFRYYLNGVDALRLKLWLS